MEFFPQNLSEKHSIISFVGIPSPGALGKPETISFNLRGKVTEIHPEVEINVEQPLYEEKIISFSVNCEKFSAFSKLENAEFRIELFETPPLSDPVCFDHIFDEDSISKLPKEFHSDLKRISAKNLQKGLNLRYLPMQENRRECYVVFKSENFDFVGRIRARGTLPAPTALPGTVDLKIWG